MVTMQTHNIPYTFLTLRVGRILYGSFFKLFYGLGHFFFLFLFHITEFLHLLLEIHVVMLTSNLAVEVSFSHSKTYTCFTNCPF